jgi:hypothetical protein
MKSSLKMITGLVFVIICLLVTRTVVSNGIATSGEMLGQITEKTNSYKMQNKLIGEQLYSTLSLTNLVKKASDLGFVSEGKVVSLSQSLPLAARQ